MISHEDVKHLATLSRLRFNEAEVAQYTKDLGSIFEYAKALNELPTDEIAPSSHAIPIESVFREDVIVPFDADALLINAPDEEGHAFKVPQILAD